MWNPDLSSKEIMAEACAKLYGPAAEHMLGFYQVLEAAVADAIHYDGNWSLPNPEMICTTRRIERQASGYLQDAAETAPPPASIARIQAERRMWNHARQLLARRRRPNTVTLKHNGKYKTMDWSDRRIDGNAVKDLFDLNLTASIFVILKDQEKKRRVVDKQEYNLSNVLRFVTAE